MSICANLNVGLLFPFRNPPAWRKPFADFYAEQLAQTRFAEELGYDEIWLTEHHFAEDGYSPAVLPIASAIAKCSASGGGHVIVPRGTYLTGAITLLGVSLLASLLIGYVRGTRSRMWREGDGRVYSQGTVLTVGLFLGLIAFKFALGTVAYLTHIPYATGMGEILLMVGLMVGVHAEIVWQRAQAMGARKTSTGTTSATAISR